MELYKMNKIEKKHMGGLQRKLMFPVLLAVVCTFLLVLVVFMFYFAKVNKEHEINNQKEQMSKVVHGIATIQKTAENIAQQIAVSDMLQDEIRYPARSWADYFIASGNIQTSLKNYIFIADYIEEIIIYTEDGKTFNSCEYRDQFNSQESWYSKFKQSGQKKGYSCLHREITSQNGMTQDIISYIMSYYAISDYKQYLGDLIINIDFDIIEQLLTFDSPILEGYALYNKLGQQIISEGNITQSYKQINSVTGEVFEDEDGNIYVISKELGDEWMIVSEISGKLLQRQIFIIELMICGSFILLILILVVILYYNIRKIVEPINSLCVAAEELGGGNFEISVNLNTGDEIQTLADIFNRMVKDVKYYTQMSVRHEKALRKSQVDQLLLQINPHFIYNTLNSIVYIARNEGNIEIERFVNAFISLLQSSLHVENKVYIALEEEIKNVENYLILQKYRYENKFEEVIDCSEKLREYLVPKVILQPIVENAIFHGIAPLDGSGKLFISVRREQNYLCIIVEDNGVGMSENTIKTLFDEKYIEQSGMRKIGMANVRQRIKEICGDEYGFSIESKEGKGTRVVIHLPIKIQEESEDISDTFY